MSAKGASGEIGGGEDKETEADRAKDSGPTEADFLKVYYTNAGGLYGKLAELRVFMEMNKVDIVCITETHFNDKLEEAEMEIPGYNKFVSHRNFKLDKTIKSVSTSDKGGSIIYIRESISVVAPSFSKALGTDPV